MKTFVPNYYKKFKCIADKCLHNCCIGWEIDIDEDTLDYYDSLEGDLGARIQDSIVRDDTPHFRVDDNGRCANLAENGLCNIISDLGEGALCEICTMHPRYRQFFSDREELGLGLCCEEACRIILSFEEKMTLEEYLDDGESADISPEDEVFRSIRDEILSVVQNREYDIGKRITKLQDKYGFSLDSIKAAEWSEIFSSLEQLDPKWNNVLKNIGCSGAECLCDVGEVLGGHADEQLLVYFILRHLHTENYESELENRLKFAVLSLYMIRGAAKVIGNGKITFESACEAARMYSSEIEYSEENVDELLFELSFI